ncbi:6-hydroxymethylpterin diphosphokinase MptE-like protein [Colwelliaceae bacterium 6441]
MSLADELERLVEQAETQLNKLSDRNRLEKKLAQSLPKKFAENMEAFSKYLPDIYEKFKDYTPEKMQLTCSPSGDANIYDDTRGSYLYDDDPIKQCRKQVDKKLKHPQFTRWSFQKDEAEYGFIHTKYLNKLNDIYLKAAEELPAITRMPDHLGSMIVFGIGLGYHLKPLLQDISIDFLYLCEPNCDWFYASIYTAEWKTILETIDERDGSTHLYLGASYKDFTNDFLDSLKDKGSFNAVNAALYQHYPSKELEKLVKNFSEDFHRCSIGWGFFDDGVLSIAHDYENGKRKVPLLKKSAQLPKQFSNIPVFVVANGPSLDKSIEAIKSYQGDAVIFSCGSAIQPLLANNIIPDFHVANERTKSTYHFLNEFVDHDIMKKMSLLTTNIMYPQCVDLFKWTGMSFKPAEPSTVIGSDFIDRHQNFNHLMFSNPVVGNTGAAFACYIGFKDIYLFGLDFGYRDPTHHHSKDSLYYSEGKKEIESLGKEVRKGEIEVEANFGGSVFSTTFFNVGKHCATSLFTRFSAVNGFNCSDGAKIGNTLPLNSNDILISKSHASKESLIEYIKTNLFIDRNFSEDEYIEWLDMDKFDYICDKLIEYLNKDFNSRAELANALKLQARYLFSYAKTRYRHIYFLLQGSLTYIQALFRMMLYSFDDEKASLKYVQEGILVFNQFMEEAKIKNRNSLDETSTHEWGVIDVIKQERAKK